MAIENLITDHLDLWVSTVRPKSSAGRGSTRKLELTGIKKLRELILDLAVRGKLVSQDPNDEPASVLLARIAAEKARLVKEGKIKKPKALPEITKEDRLFELPVGWEWTYFQSLTSYIQRGKGPTYAEKGVVRVVSQKCVQWSGFDSSQTRFIDDSSLSGYQEDRFLQPGDLLWNSTGTGTVGRVNVLGYIPNKSMVADSHVTVIRTLGVNCHFIWCYIAAPGIQGRIDPDHENSLVSGSTKQVELSTSVVSTLLLPVPPLSEQHRIVAKVDELMALCDQLEQQSEAQLAAHQTLVETLLTTLTDSGDADELAQNWARLSTHFDTLFTTEASIDALKQTILQLAVMGKLVPQDPADEPASVLLERIAAEKARLVKEGKIKKEKPLPAINDDEKPFMLPPSWEWSTVAELGEIKLGRQRSPQNHTGEHMVPYLRVANVYEGFIDTSDVKEMNFTPAEQEIFRLQVDDILLNEGQSLELVGRASIYNGEVPGACFQNTLLRFRTSSAIIPKYALIYFRYCLHSGRFQRASTQTTNIAHLSAFRLAPIELPLAPLGEQHKIALKTNELLSLCDDLKSCLKASQQTQLVLAAALVESALSG
ncbi:restriction endonuclease subunit S [Aeromonas hydrophila]|nr:restriction endonuclease subunit S [Aeromonas hydrophila]